MGKRILLVEGKDDQHVMWNLCMVREVPRQFEVRRPRDDDDGDDENGGDTVLIESLAARLLESDLECLAVVIDANSGGPVARWQAIRSRLVNEGYTGIPDRHGEQGTVFDLSLLPETPRSIRFGTWIMPDNRSQGMLEDFVSSLIREDDGMRPFVNQFLESIPADQRRYRLAHHSKAWLHSWLAVSERPGRPVGQAIHVDKYVDAHHASAEPFLNWIRAALLD